MSRINTAVRGLIRSAEVQRAALSTGVAEEFAKSYVAGVDIPEVEPAMSVLREQGLSLALAYLPLSDGETETPGKLMAALGQLGEQSTGLEVSIKPSSLGLRVDRRAAARQLDKLCAAAEEASACVTLEMQGTAGYEACLELWRSARNDFPTLGITLPADVRRAQRDAANYGEPGARLRLCVGSYPVPKELGFRTEHEKSKALVRCIRTAMESGAYAMVASHDPTIIAITQELARRNSITAEGFEFQMFYGVRPLEQRRLVDIGYRARTYLPYGPAWFEYLMTRIAARPRTAFNYLRAVGDKR